MRHGPISGGLSMPTPSVTIISDHPNLIGERNFEYLKQTWNDLTERIDQNQVLYENLAGSLDNDRRLRSQIEEAMNALSGYVASKTTSLGSGTRNGANIAEDGRIY